MSSSNGEGRRSQDKSRSNFNPHKGYSDRTPSRIVVKQSGSGSGDNSLYENLNDKSIRNPSGKKAYPFHSQEYINRDTKNQNEGELKRSISNNSDNELKRSISNNSDGELKRSISNNSDGGFLGSKIDVQQIPSQEFTQEFKSDYITDENQISHYSFIDDSSSVDLLEEHVDRFESEELLNEIGDIEVYIPNDKGIIKYTKEFMLRMKELCTSIDFETQHHLAMLGLFYSPQEYEDENPNVTNEDLWDIPISRTDQKSLSMWSVVETITNETDTQEEKNKAQKILDEELHEMNTYSSDMSDPMAILQILKSNENDNSESDNIDTISSRVLNRDETRSRLHSNDRIKSTEYFINDEDKLMSSISSKNETFDVSQIEKNLISNQVISNKSLTNPTNDRVNAFFAATQNYIQHQRTQEIPSYYNNQFDNHQVVPPQKIGENIPYYAHSNTSTPEISQIPMNGYFPPNINQVYVHGMDSNFPQISNPHHVQSYPHMISDNSQYPSHYLQMNPHINMQHVPYLQQVSQIPSGQILSNTPPQNTISSGQITSESNTAQASRPRRLIPVQMLKQQGATLHELQKQKKQDEVSGRENSIILEQKLSPQAFFQSFQNAYGDVNVNDKMENAIDMAEIEKMYK